MATPAAKVPLHTRPIEPTFVFGADMSGDFSQGSAAIAARLFEADTDIGVGASGNAYAIPYRNSDGEMLSFAALGPHTQAAYPPVPFRGYAPPRPPEVVTAAFQFAAEHPEVLSYVPCFCGCQQGGHKGNHDCFVRSRAANGDVIEWEEHGVECAVCIDVATRSRQLLASGASVTEIRAAIEREFLPSAPTMTPTPAPPAGAAAHSH